MTETPSSDTHRLAAKFQSITPPNEDITQSTNEGKPGRDNPYIRCCFIKAVSTRSDKALGVVRGFAKTLRHDGTAGILHMPAQVTHTVQQFPDFESFARAMYKMRDTDHMCHITGMPLESALATADLGAPKITRTLSYFDHQLSRVAVESMLTGFMVLDLDGKKEQYGSETFSLALSEQALTPDHVHMEARHQVSRLMAPGDIGGETYDPTKYARYLGPLFVRLSSTFGVDPKLGRLKAHVYVPLSEMVPIDQIREWLTTHAWTDTTFYRNPTQPIFTCAPRTLKDGDSYGIDPLSDTGYDIPRFYYFSTLPAPASNLHRLARSNPYSNDTFDTQGFPAAKILTYRAGGKDSSVEKVGQATARYRTPGTHRHSHADDEPGRAGAFNRSLATHPSRSLKTQLARLGYLQVGNDLPDGGSRWKSPTSTSNSPGCVIYPTGHVYDHHGTSPINDMVEKVGLKPRPLSPFGLFRIRAATIGPEETKRFNAAVDKCYMQDTAAQTHALKDHQNQLSHLHDQMARDDVDIVWQQILTDTFYRGIATWAKTRLYKKIVAEIKDKTNIKITLEELKQFWSTLRYKLSAELADIVSGNPEMLNARLVQAESHIYKQPGKDYWFIESTTGDKLEMYPSADAAEPRVMGLILDMAMEPDSWRLAAVNTNVQAVLKHITKEADGNPHYKLPAISQSVYAFKREPIKEGDPMVLRAIDFMSEKIATVNMDQFVLHYLPFTETEYLQSVGKLAKDYAQYAPNFHRFLHSSFANHEDRIETIRDMFTYCLCGVRKNQYIMALYGLPGSGKSTIKNLLCKLFGSAFVLETDPSRLGDDNFSLAGLTEYTRVLVVNEFNTTMFHGNSSRKNMVVNFLKALSGRDSVTVRKMRVAPEELKSDALPLLLSNSVPSIRDSAFQSRLRSVRFDISFDRHEGSQVFQENLFAELPGIFHWAITNPRKATILEGEFEFAKTDSLLEDTQDARVSADPIETFLHTYVKQAPGKGIYRPELVYWISLYMEKHLDIDLDSWIDQRKLKDDRKVVNKQALQLVFPHTRPVKRRVDADHLEAIKSRCPQPDNGDKTWACGLNKQNKFTAYSGIQWADPDKMGFDLNTWYTPKLKTVEAKLKDKKAFTNK